MNKLIKLIFAYCLSFRIMFTWADIQNYEEYIIALKELEEKYKNVDKTIDLSGCTMREVIKQLHDILQLRVHSKIGTAQKEDSHPALLKVNDVIYELYFHGTKEMPGNCMLKKQKEKNGKSWTKTDGNYNSELNTEENYIEQNLLFCLEIVRRKFCQDDDNNIYDKFYDIPVLEGIVIGLNLVNTKKNCSVLSFFGCFTGKRRESIADSLIKMRKDLTDLDLIKLKLEFFNTRIDERVILKGSEKYFKDNLFYFINKNQKEVIKKLQRKGFILSESMEDLKSFREKSSFMSQLEFRDGIYEETLRAISKNFAGQSVYVLDGNADSYYLKVLKKGSKFNTRKNFDLKDLDDALGFFYATGKDNRNRWFYLNKSNNTMYLLSEAEKSSVSS